MRVSVLVEMLCGDSSDRKVVPRYARKPDVRTEQGKIDDRNLPPEERADDPELARIVAEQDERSVADEGNRAIQQAVAEDVPVVRPGVADDARDRSSCSYRCWRRRCCRPALEETPRT